MIRTVKTIRLGSGYREIFGRSMHGQLRSTDGFKMSLETDSGLLFVFDPKDKIEAALHISSVDHVLLDDEPVAEAKPEKKPAKDSALQLK